MTTLKKTLFISDLHLDSQHPLITGWFLQLLKQDHSNVDALYILGDLFETWIGDDAKQEFHDEIIQALRTATQNGLPIYLMHGNRDFLIGRQFLQATGCQLLSDETIISLYGNNVLLMHGDTLCTRDTAYLKWRKIARNRLVQCLFLHLFPLHTRQKIANKMRAKSADYTQHAAAEIMDVTQEEVERVMKKHDVQFLIHGHTHQPNKHEFTLQQKPAMRIVLDAWHKQGNMLIWDSEGKKELIWFK
jgi:UDP-2,3-diacylglucosamine hydrolase